MLCRPACKGGPQQGYATVQSCAGDGCKGVPPRLTRILERNRAIVFGNRAIAQAWVDEEPRVRWVSPKGVSTSYIQFDIPMDDEEFCLKLLRERGVSCVTPAQYME